MRKFCSILLMLICIMGIPACSTPNSSQDGNSTIEENVLIEESTQAEENDLIEENTQIKEAPEDTIQKTEKIWTEPEIINMFNNEKKSGFEYIDCVLTPDKASNRVGAVLFWDKDGKTTNVAFYNADGHSQQCGSYAETTENPNFTYLGDGTVRFQLEAEDGTIYNQTITISVDGANVNFTVDDDLPKQQS